jgi:hypothetical protein
MDSNRADRSRRSLLKAKLQLKVGGPRLRGCGTAASIAE